MSDIHSRIKQLRELRGMSLEALAEKVGVSWQAAQQWEKPDGTAPKRTRLAKVAAVLETSQEYLFSGYGQGAPESKIRHFAEPATLRYQNAPQHPDIVAVVRMMEGADDRGKAMALGAVRAALSDLDAVKKNGVR